MGTLYGFVLEDDDEDCFENNLNHKEDCKFYCTVPKLKGNQLDNDKFLII